MLLYEGETVADSLADLRGHLEERAEVVWEQGNGQSAQLGDGFRVFFLRLEVCREWLGGGVDGSRWKSQGVVWSKWNHASELRVAALCQLIGSAAVYSDNRGVVHSLKKGEVECVSVSHKDAYLWIQDWDQVDAHKEHDRLTVCGSRRTLRA